MIIYGNGQEGIEGRISFSFLPKGGQNEIVWIIRGASMHSCAKHAGKLGESEGMLPQEILILDLLLGAIW